jgi:hypothetical protein
MPNDQRRIGFAASSHFGAVSISKNYRLVSSDRSLEIYYDLELIFSRFRLLRAPSFRLLAGRLSTPASPCPWVLGPLRDITRAQPLARDGSQPPLRSVIRFSRPLDVFLRTQVCELISSRYRVQDSFPFRGFSPRAATLPLRKDVAPWPLSLDSLTDLRRLPLVQVLGFEAFIRARPRSLQRRYSQLCTPLPSSGSAPPGSLLPPVGLDFLASSALDVFSLRLRFRDRGSTSSSASLPAEAGVASPLRRACPSFRAFPPTLRARAFNSPPVALRRFDPGAPQLERFGYPHVRLVFVPDRSALGCPRTVRGSFDASS